MEACAVCGFNSNIRGNCVKEETAVAIAIDETINGAIANAAGSITTNWANLSSLHVLSIRNAAVASSLECSIEGRGAVARCSIDSQGGEGEVVNSSRIASAALGAILSSRALAAFDS